MFKFVSVCIKSANEGAIVWIVDRLIPFQSRQLAKFNRCSEVHELSLLTNIENKQENRQVIVTFLTCMNW